MNTKLQEGLTGLTLALTALHSTGVRLGHFGSTDFIALAESITETFLTASTKPTQAGQVVG